MAIGTNPALGSGSIVDSGSTGPSVADVQRLLGVPADGVNGPQTTAAIKNFQRSQGLTPDGIVGPKTWAALNPPTVAQGDRGAAVARVQRDLKLTQDGIDGPRTTTAIEQFQKAHGLTPDGVVGKQTWAALDAAQSASPAPATATAASGTSAAGSAPAKPSLLSRAETYIKGVFDSIFSSGGASATSSTASAPKPTPPAAAASAASPFETNMRKLVTDSEGYRNHTYIDTMGNPTVGIGFNLNRSNARSALAGVGADYDAVRAGKQDLTDTQVNELFSSDLKNAEGDARGAVSNYDQLSDARKSVVVDMEFNLGKTGFSQFTGTIGAIEDGDFDKAATHMQNSAWYGQVGDRSVRDVQMMQSGDYPTTF